MNTQLLTLVALFSALVSCGAAVFSVWFLSRGTDAELKSDVEELAILVDRLAKATRREKMSRVRQSAGLSPDEPPTTAPVDFPQDPKSALRRRLAAMNRS